MSKNNQLYIIALALFSLFISCQSGRKPYEPVPEFEAYIAQYSRLLPEAASPLRITLAFKVSDSIRQDDLLTNSLLGFDPGVAGKAIWADEYTLIFTPDIRWPENEEFVNVSFFLGKLKQVPADFHIFRFHTRLAPPAIAAGLPQFMSDGDSLWIEGQFSLSHPLVQGVPQDLASATLNGRPLKLIFSVSENNRSIVYKSRSFSPAPEPRELSFRWNARQLGIARKGSYELMIPGKENFRVVQLEAIMYPNQRIKIRLSQPPAPDQSVPAMVLTEPEVDFQIDSRENLLELIPKENISGTFRLKLSPGLRSISGKNLEPALDTILEFDELRPAVRLLNSSTIITGNNMMLPFQTIGLRAVDVQVIKVFGNNMLRHLQTNDLDGNYDLRLTGRVVARQQMVFSTADEASLMSWQKRAIDLSKLIVTDQSSLYRVYITFKKSYTALPCAGQLPPPPGRITSAELRQWGADYYYQPDYYYPDNYEWEERDNPCHDSYYNSDRFVAKSLFYTRLGLMSKKAENSREYRFYVTDLQSAMPVKDATVELFDFQLQRIARAKTDVEGQVVLTQQLVDAWIAVATHGNSTVYLKLDGSQLQPLGRFDVDGTRPSAGLNGFIFTERGVYRPGDTLHIGFMLDNNPLPRAHPVVLELLDARNRPAGRQTLSFGAHNLIRFSMPTRPESPTGIWTIRITVGDASFTRRIRVETVMPNRLKIAFVPENRLFGKEDLQPAIGLRVNWLHGDAASGLRLAAEQTVSDVPVQFKGFEGYNFSNQAIEAFRSHKMELSGTLLDENGSASMQLQLPEASRFRGRRAVELEVRAYEPGGAFSVASNRYLSDTYSHYIGIEDPALSVKDFLPEADQHQFNVVRLSTSGIAEGNLSLNYQIFRLNDYWWWSGDGNSRAAYVSTTNAVNVAQGEVLLNNGKGILRWKPERFDLGTFIIVVSENNGHSTSVLLNIYGVVGTSRNQRISGANQLRVSCDKSNYLIGDKAVISFEAPAEGRLLLSLENGSRQLSWRWVTTQKGLNRIEVPVRPEFSPNVYAHLSLIQPVGNVENDMPVRLYGIVNLKIENPHRKLEPRINAPDAVEAGKPFTIEISESKGRPMSYMLAIVDEGLLDLTNFRTPDPYAHFNQREALGVFTSDMFEQVLGAYGGKLEQVLAVGGDENLPRREKARQQRFKPVVIVRGPLLLAPGAKARHSFNITNYTGAVRVMLIAANNTASGASARSLHVRNKLMVLATAPRLLRPDDEFDLPVTLFDDTGKAGQIAISLRSEGKLKVTGTSTQRIQSTGKGEQTVVFRVKALEEGSGSLTISAKNQEVSVSNQVNLSIEQPFVRQQLSKSLQLEPGKSIQIKPQFPGTRSRMAQLEAMRLPDIDLGGKLNSLLSYPHGCTEQITSQGMAMLYLPGLLKSGSEEMQQYERAMASALRQVEQRIDANGHTVYWPNTAQVHEYTFVYAVHFLTLALREGRYSGGALYDRTLEAQKQRARRWSDWHSGDLELFLQSYRLYVLAQAGTPLINAMNRMRELPSLDDRSATMLALAYATAGKKQAARELLLGISNRRKSVSDFEATTFGSPVRDLSIRVLSLLAIDEKAEAFSLFDQLATDVRIKALNTNETGWLLLAWQELAKLNPAGDEASYELSGKNSGKYTLQSSVQRHLLDVEDRSLTLRNTGAKGLYFNLLTSAIPEEKEAAPISRNAELKVWFTALDGRALEIKDLKQGETAIMRVKVVNRSNKQRNFLALQNILPAGWEVLGSNVPEGSPTIAAQFSQDYTDVRDDRVINYFSLAPGQERIYSVRISVTYSGNFVFPGIFLNSMYETDIEAFTGASRIEITPRSRP
ncbi:MAG: hypothetical protein IPM52_01180 [Bacteroidetes bacterium]|nr:hypothetical protein [Bacteroidota bacterium]